MLNSTATPTSISGEQGNEDTPGGSTSIYWDTTSGQGGQSIQGMDGQIVILYYA
jgi:hypothetical protein